MSTLKEQREAFVRGLTPILDEYIRGDSTYMLLQWTGRAHTAPAMELKTRLTAYLSAVSIDEETAGQQWLSVIKSVRAFHAKLQHAESRTLLPAVEKYIDNSDYQTILTDPFVFDEEKLAALNSLSFNVAEEADKAIYTPVDANRLLHDLHRFQNIITITPDGQTFALTDWIKIEVESDEKGESYKIVDMENGELKTFTQADAAVKKIASLFGKHFIAEKTFTQLVSYLSQNAVLTTLSQDFLSLVRYTGLQMLGAPNLAPLNKVDNMQTVIMANIEGSSDFQLDQPKKFFNIASDAQGPVITVRYVFDNYLFLGSEDEVKPLPFLTPIQVEERFHCDLSGNGQQAHIQHEEKNRFTLVNEMPLDEVEMSTRPSI